MRQRFPCVGQLKWDAGSHKEISEAASAVLLLAVIVGVCQVICLRKHCAHIAMTHDCIWLMEPAFGMVLLSAYQLLSLATRFNLDQLTSTSFCK